MKNKVKTINKGDVVLQIVYTKEKTNVVEMKFECNWNVGIGGSIWTSGSILNSHLQLRWDYYKPKFHNRCVVELGSGTGCVGLATGVCFTPSTVYLTDLQDHIYCIERNVQLNQHLLPPSVQVQSQALTWGHESEENQLLHMIQERNETIDIILGTDVAYSETLYEPLLHTLKSLANEHTLILLGLNRTDTSIKFFQMLRSKGFEYYKVSNGDMPDEYKRSDFGIFQIQLVIQQN